MPGICASLSWGSYRPTPIREMAINGSLAAGATAAFDVYPDV